jgi:hypothetical protein
MFSATPSNQSKNRHLCLTNDASRIAPDVDCRFFSARIYREAPTNVSGKKMSDSVTIGAMAASALAMAADAALKGAVGEAVKDAYKTLKEKIAAWAGGDVEALAKEPDSKGRQLTVAEKIDKQSLGDQTDVQALAKALMDALEANERDQPIGIDVGRIHAWRVRFGTIEVAKGTGLRAAEIVTPELSVDNLKVGK